MRRSASSRRRSKHGSASRWPRTSATIGSSARSSRWISGARAAAAWHPHRAPRRADAAGLLRRQGGEAREPCRRDGARLPGYPARMRPVPQPSVRPLDSRRVLGLCLLLRGGNEVGPGRTPPGAIREISAAGPSWRFPGPSGWPTPPSSMGRSRRSARRSKTGTTPRSLLAAWITAPENPLLRARRGQPRLGPLLRHRAGRARR